MLKHLGKYRIDSVLGKGAMGVVYKAFDPHATRVVALKTIHRKSVCDYLIKDLLARFRNEAHAAGRLSHSNIVVVYDYGETDDEAYIAMEYVNGTVLNRLLIANQPTNLPWVILWMSQLLRALDYAHARGVVHCDIKPANLIITPKDKLKITDFGIACVDSLTLTQTRAMVGTPSYMSPEQCCGSAVDARSDIFSAGIVLYQLLTGMRPFVGSATTVMRQILNNTPSPPSTIHPALGTSFDGVLRKSLAKKPADRFTTARDFLNSLTRAYCDDQSGRSSVRPERTLTEFDPTALESLSRKTCPEHLHIPREPGQAKAALSGAITSIDTISTKGVVGILWREEAFPELEAELTRQVGPVAKVLLERAGADAADLDQLSVMLLVHIPSETGKSAFRETVSKIKKRLSDDS